ncbi:MAG: hypothetical protein ACRELX_12795 [Longimicrobiales bacterium]
MISFRLTQRAAALDRRAGGVGFVASMSFLMPYVQIGRTGETGTMWFTTQGISFTRGELEGGTFWMPSVAVRDQREDGSRAATFHLSAGVPLRADEWIMAIGLFVEFGRARTP